MDDYTRDAEQLIGALLPDIPADPEAWSIPDALRVLEVGWLLERSARFALLGLSTP
ncbi:MAG: hypothetical protein U0Y82_16765 [Thermoleophilia bacterium]